MAQSATYVGLERRKNRVFVTRHTEYHCRDGVCLAVRDVQSGDFVPGHAALGRRAYAGVRFERGFATGSDRDDVHLGEALWFLPIDPGGDEANVVTTSVVAIVRPPKAVASEYRRRQRARLR